MEATHSSSALASAGCQVLVAGSVFLDVVMAGLQHPPRPGEEQWVSEGGLMPGGSANQAITLARLGVPTALHCYLGTDAAGSLVRSMIEAEGVSLAGAHLTEQQNITVSLAFDGDRAMTTVGRDDVPSFEGLEAPRALVASLPTLGAHEASLASWSAGRHEALIIADASWDPTGAWDEADLEVLRYAQVFTPNEVEARHYARTDNLAEAARFFARYVPQVLITRGPQGVLALDAATEGTGLMELPAMDVPLVDPTGAGDSFAAGLTCALLAGTHLRAAISLGQLTAAYTLGQPGGSLNAPRPQELRAFAAQLAIPEEFSLEALDALT